jgi:hypothetical protein
VTCLSEKNKDLQVVKNVDFSKWSYCNGRLVWVGKCNLLGERIWPKMSSRDDKIGLEGVLSRRRELKGALKGKIYKA